MREMGFINRQEKVLTVGDGDRISNLPDALITYILSFLSTEESVRTSLLSTRWKLLWASVPVLHLSYTEFYRQKLPRNVSFSCFVDRFLVRNSSLEKLKLRGRGRCPIEWWISAVKDHVQEMELNIYLEKEGDPRLKSVNKVFEVPPSLFMCRLLVVLKLEMNVYLDIPKGSICFPCLKILKLLKWIKFKEDTSQNLISSCPVLEELNIQRHELAHLLLPQQFIVASQTLKRLTLRFYESEHSWNRNAGKTNVSITTMLDTPGLKFLDIIDEFSSEYVVREMSSIKEAKLDLRGWHNNFFTDKPLFAKYLNKFLRAICNTEYLLLSNATMVSLMVATYLDFPTFNNLTHFEIKYVDRPPITLKFITEFIDCSPNLELLKYGTYKFQVKEADWISHPYVAEVFPSACDVD